MYRVGVRYKIPDPPTSPSLISLNGFCGRKAKCFPTEQNSSSDHWKETASVVCVYMKRAMGCISTIVVTVNVYDRKPLLLYFKAQLKLVL